MVVSTPLIPWGGVALGGVPLDSHDKTNSSHWDTGSVKWVSFWPSCQVRPVRFREGYLDHRRVLKGMKGYIVWTGYSCSPYKNQSCFRHFAMQCLMHLLLGSRENKHCHKVKLRTLKTFHYANYRRISCKNSSDRFKAQQFSTTTFITWG